MFSCSTFSNLKASGATKAKIDSAINEGKVRINGQKVIKKSDTIFAGDAVDLIIGYANNDPDKLKITRYQFIDIDDKINARGKYGSKLEVSKGMVIDNYEGPMRYE